PRGGATPAVPGGGAERRQRQEPRAWSAGLLCEARQQAAGGPGGLPRPRPCPGPRPASVHPAHAAAGHRRRLLRLLLLDDHRLRREQEARDGRRVLERRAGDLGRVDHTRLDQVLVLVSLGVVAEADVLVLADTLDHDRALEASVLRDLPERLLERAQHDLHAGLLVAILELEVLQPLLDAHERDAAARNDALLDSRTGGVQRVLDAGLLLLPLRLGRRADVGHRDAARELRAPLLELLAVVARGGLVDRDADLADAALDLLGVARAVDDRRVVLVHDDA